MSVSFRARIIGRTLGIIVGCVAILAALPFAFGTESGPHIGTIEVGIGGKFKLGRWAPLRVTIAGMPPSVRGYLEVTAPDGDGQPATFRTKTFTSSSERDEDFELLFRMGWPNGRLAVRWRHDPDGGVVEPPKVLAPSEFGTPLVASQFLYIVVGGNDGSLTSQIPQPREESLRTTVAHVGSRDLPRDALSYDGVDGVLVNIGDGAILESISKEQWSALLRWVTLGGRLVISAGLQAEKALAPDSPLAALELAKFEKQTTLKDAAGLIAYVKSADQDQLGQSRSQRFDAPLPRLRPLRGTVEAHSDGQSDGLPLVLRAPHGFGEIALLALDFTEPPVKEWPPRGYLFLRLFRHDVNKLSDRGGASLNTGYDDLAGQIRAALDHFSDVGVFSFWVVAGCAVISILIIGPFDYYLTQRWFKRPHWTWFTFPLEIAVCIGAIVWITQREKGDQLRLRQLDLIDFDLASAELRGTSWMNFFSPRDERLDLEVRVDPTQTANSNNEIARSEGNTELRVAFTGQGLPGNVLGGMNAPDTAWLGQAAVPYAHNADHQALEQYPIPVWSSRQFLTEWSQSAGSLAGGRLNRTESGQLDGQLSNNSSADWVDAILVYKTFVFRLGTIKAGEQVQVGEAGSTGLETYFLRRKAVGDKLTPTPYDPTDTDLRRMIDMLTFYDLVGGRGYVRLLNRYQSNLEMSGLIGLQRAILIARVANPAAVLSQNQNPLTNIVDPPVTFLRLVLPVSDPTNSSGTVDP